MRIPCALSRDHDHSTTGLFVGAWGNGDAELRQCLRRMLTVERQALVRWFCLPSLFPFGESSFVSSWVSPVMVFARFALFCVVTSHVRCRRDPGEGSRCRFRDRAWQSEGPVLGLAQGVG